MCVDPGKILKLFHDPPNGNLSEVYNSKLAQAHIAAENTVTVSEVLELCDSTKSMKLEDSDPCFLWCDAGNLLHVTYPSMECGKVLRSGITLSNMFYMNDIWQSCWVFQLLQ